MTAYYEGTKPYRSDRLSLGDGYDMYFEESGEPTGIPVVYLHGGPGAGMDPVMRRVHDPKHYRFVMFDQRGAGRSKPLGDVRINNTATLLQDIEFLRRSLGIDRWIVSGGSWGSTLALAYAERHAERCVALVLRGIFLGTFDEVRWIYSGLRLLFPLEWRRCFGRYTLTEQEHLYSTIYQRVFGRDHAVAVAAATALAKFELLCASVSPEEADIDAELTGEFALAYSRLMCHYVINDFFLDPNALIGNVDRIRHIPGYIINGRNDWICPPWSAVRLHDAWPTSRLTLLFNTGHLSSEPGIACELLRTMESLKDKGIPY